MEKGKDNLNLAALHPRIYCTPTDAGIVVAEHLMKYNEHGMDPKGFEIS